jgi:hypothetical protein
MNKNISKYNDYTQNIDSHLELNLVGNKIVAYSHISNSLGLSKDFSEDFEGNPYIDAPRTF